MVGVATRIYLWIKNAISSKNLYNVTKCTRCLNAAHLNFGKTENGKSKKNEHIEQDIVVVVVARIKFS